MRRVANIATYPARREKCLPVFQSIARQVDVINIVLNEYDDVPREWTILRNANFIIPPRDLKDVGKFFPICEADDFVFLCDDDILYPSDYTDRMIALSGQYSDANPILGLHGVIYSDYYDGKSRTGRLVHVFSQKLDEASVVNQLGTGTVFLRGHQMPRFDYMDGSAKFVDIRFAKHAYSSGYPLICVDRGRDWLVSIENEETIFHSFTNHLPMHALQEVQEFGGISKLPADLSAVL